ncbi:transmembrane protein 128 [Nothobranchius furzeri]|uniref:Transmembrane protein 128 n=7 Tax=Nothobranchius TaxID=28779 RepID=A0A1A8AAI5_NOTFU|nr:transmembrane protein 128 [Nothobranchius furzeri]KAF7208238.1 transmembrane protein 128 [Nothobranchius furzeri]
MSVKNNMFNDSELATLRNRFKRDAEFLMQTTTAATGEDDKSPEGKDDKPLPRINRHSVFWIVASVVVTYYADFLRVLMENNDIKSWWFNVGLMLLGICLSLATFCIVYLEWVRGIQHYEQEYPAIPPITTAAFIAASCSFNIALWPVWSFFTPLILFTQFMGVVMLISLLG